MPNDREHDLARVRVTPEGVYLKPGEPAPEVPERWQPHDPPACPVCGTRPVVQVEAGALHIDLRYCEPCRQNVEAASIRAAAERENTERDSTIRRRLRDAGINTAEYGNASFETFIPGADAGALNKARAFARDAVAWYAAPVDTREPGPVLYLYSRRAGETVAPGNGKTHLQTAIARDILLDPRVPVAAGPVVRYAFLPQFLEELRGSIDSNAAPGERYHDRIRALKQAPVALLDDIGAHRWTPWVVETLTDITNARLGRPTVYASNWTLDELPAAAAGELRGARGPRPIIGIDDPDSVVDPTEAIYRLVSRLSARARQVCLTGPDRRPGLLSQA